MFLQQHQQLGMRLMNEEPQDVLKNVTDQFGSMPTQVVCSVHPMPDGTWLLKGPTGAITLLRTSVMSCVGTRARGV